MRAAMTNLHNHLDYIDWLAEQGNWLAGKAMSLADLAAAAHLSVTDYFGDIDWDRHPEAKAVVREDQIAPVFPRPACRCGGRAGTGGALRRSRFLADSLA